jgi:hypothetical protein
VHSSMLARCYSSRATDARAAAFPPAMVTAGDMMLTL